MIAPQNAFTGNLDFGVAFGFLLLLLEFGGFGILINLVQF